MKKRLKNSSIALVITFLLVLLIFGLTGCEQNTGVYINPFMNRSFTSTEGVVEYKDLDSVEVVVYRGTDWSFVYDNLILDTYIDRPDTFDIPDISTPHGKHIVSRVQYYYEYMPGYGQLTIREYIRGPIVENFDVYEFDDYYLLIGEYGIANDYELVPQ